MADTVTAETPVVGAAEAAPIKIAAPVAEPQAAKAPEVAQLKANGWSDAEIEAAQKRGMLPKEEKPKPVEAVKPIEPVKAEEKPKPAGNLPDLKFTPEEEAEVSRLFGKGHPLRAFYFRAKNERHARQAMEARARELEAKLEVFEKAAKPVEEVAEADDDRPLTKKELLSLLAEQARAGEQQREAQTDRAAKIQTATAEQEEYAKTVYSDYDQTVELAKDVLANFESMFPAKVQAKVRQLIKDLQVKAFNADQFGIEDYTAADIAYEIGKLHPNYGKAEEPKKGGLSPEQMKRVVANTQRVAPSAAVPSGGVKRVISADDVTPETLNAMTYKERAAFRQKYPEQYARLVRS